MTGACGEDERDLPTSALPLKRPLGRNRLCWM